MITAKTPSRTSENPPIAGNQGLGLWGEDGCGIEVTIAEIEVEVGNVERRVGAFCSIVMVGAWLVWTGEAVYVAVVVDVERPGLRGAVSVGLVDPEKGVNVLVLTRVGTVWFTADASELAQATCLLPMNTIEMSRITSSKNLGQDRRISVTPVG